MAGAEKPGFSRWIAFGALIVAAPLCSAEPPFAGPSGEWTNTVTDARNAVWDLTAAYGGNYVNSVITEDSGETQVTVGYQVSFRQSGAGKLSGKGTNVINLTYGSKTTRIKVEPFAGTYRVAGSITSGHGLTRGFINYRADGTALLEGKRRRVRSEQRIDFTFTNATKTAFITHRDNATISGMNLVLWTKNLFRSRDDTPPPPGGKIASHGAYGTLEMNYVTSGDGSWTLSMSLSTTNNRVKGSAVVTLSSGQAYNYRVNGAYDPATQCSRLELAGRQLARGSVFQVVMEGNRVASIRGRIAGQAVSYRPP
jgi:hypothetical protein